MNTAIPHAEQIVARLSLSQQHKKFHEIINRANNRLVKYGNDTPSIHEICLEFTTLESALVQQILGWPRARWDKADEMTLMDAIMLYTMGVWTKKHPDVT